MAFLLIFQTLLNLLHIGSKFGLYLQAFFVWISSLSPFCNGLIQMFLVPFILSIRLEILKQVYNQVLNTLIQNFLPSYFAFDKLQLGQCVGSLRLDKGLKVVENLELWVKGQEKRLLRQIGFYHFIL